MASAVEIFVSGTDNSNPHEKSDFCIIQEAGALLGDMQGATDRLKLDFQINGEVDSELSVDLVADFAERLANIIKDAIGLAEENIGDTSTVETLREHIREIESDVQDLSSSISDLGNSSMDDIRSDIESCEEECDRIYRYIDAYKD